ncbi:MAG: hypothetical protein KBA31_18060 [Alphaproteobacteria bacterium]|nr:hypothetical protein [Alphaproteobacteria bacterium]
MAVSSAFFDLPQAARGPKLTEADLKNVATILRDAMRSQGFDAGDLLGSSTNLWGFSIEFSRHDVLVSVSPDRHVLPERCYAEVVLYHPGWLSATRAQRLVDMKRVERALHEALTGDLSAANVEWFTGKGRALDKRPRPEPARN